MRKIYYLLLFLMFQNTISAQVLINDKNEEITPNASAILELRSENKGFLLPRLSKAERQNIANPTQGLMIYLIEDNIQCLQVFDGVGWADIYCPKTNNAPIAQNVNISGIPLIGQTLTGAYTYSDNDNDAEQVSVLNWYTINNLTDTNYISLNNNTASYVVQPTDENKYIVFSVTPMAQTGLQQGTETYSAPFGPIQKEIEINTLANINEFHYDNNGDDKNEFVEIRVKGGEANQPANIQDYKIIQYRSAGTVVSSATLGNLVKTCDQSYCYYVWSPQSLQNGTIGLALINNQSEVVEFISYEGSITATEGEAAGKNSIDVGVSESNNSTPENSSIFLDADGTWKLSEESNTKGQANY